MEHRQALAALLRRCTLPAPEAFVAGAAAHLAEVYRWNQRMDLTAIPEAEAAEKHALDSVLPFAALDPAATVLDVGSGAGFPGIPLALWWPSSRVTLLEPLRKRRSFLESCCARLGLDCQVRGEAAEQLGGATWNLVTSRATLPWAVLLEIAPRLLAPGGTLLALCGPEQSPRPGELEALRTRDPAWAGLETRSYHLPGGAPRVALLGRTRG